MNYFSGSILCRWFLVALPPFFYFPANFAKQQAKAKSDITWLSPNLFTQRHINLDIYDAVWSPILLIRIHKSVVYVREVVNLIFVLPVENSAIRGVAKLTVRMRKVMVVV